MKLKQKVFQIIQPDNGTSLASRLFDWLITALILTSVVSVFVVSFDLPKGVHTALMRFEDTALAVFTVEYLLRVWTADFLYLKPDEKRTFANVFKCRVKYIFSGMAIIDLLAILPFWLPMFFPTSMMVMRALRLVRLLRVLKLNRYFDAMSTITSVLREKRRELAASMLFVFLMMMISSLLMYTAEHQAQPEVFKNAFSGLWWAVATLTTVGYGDIYPVTGIGRFLGAFIAFAGVAALAIPTGIITSGLMERVGKDDIEAEAEKRSTKDNEHDRELEEQRAMLKALDEKLNKILEKVND